MDITPSDKHRELECFKAAEEQRQDVDWPADPRQYREGAPIAEVGRPAPDPEIADPFKAQ
jgi:hypothetical protein